MVYVYDPSARGDEGVHVTDVPVAGLGVQVHPAIVTVSPGETLRTISVLVSLVTYGDVASPPIALGVIVGAVVSITRVSSSQRFAGLAGSVVLVMELPATSVTPTEV